MEPAPARPSLRDEQRRRDRIANRRLFLCPGRVARSAAAQPDGTRGGGRDAARLAGMLRERLRGMGLRFIVAEESMAPNLTTVLLPEGIGFDELAARVEERGYVIGGGSGSLEGKVFQIAISDHVTRAQVLDFTRHLDWVLSLLGARNAGLARGTPMSGVPVPSLQRI